MWYKLHGNRIAQSSFPSYCGQSLRAALFNSSLQFFANILGCKLLKLFYTVGYFN